MTFIERLNKIFYKKLQNNWDDKIFRQILLSKINSNSICLDLAAGAGIVTEMNFKSQCKEMHGIDLDERIIENTFLDYPVVGNCENLPYRDCTFDIIFCDNLFEHLENPKKIFIEVSRVLKPGGKFLFKTPNRFHYMPLISYLTPHSFHQWYNKIRGREIEDTFQTFYRANSVGDIRSLAKNLPLKINKIYLIEGRPEYLKINSFLYLLGIFYERIVNFSSLLKTFRILLIGELEKK